jgi:hypothetical protein
VGSVISGGSNNLVLGENLLFPFLKGLDKRLPQPAEGEPILSLHVVRIQINLQCFSYEQAFVPELVLARIMVLLSRTQ